MDPLTLKVMKPDLNPVFGHFENLYWIKFPLYIRDMEFDEENRLVRIFVEYHKKATFPCSCGQAGLKVHDRLIREWRALDIGSYQTIIHLAVPRVKCPHCGVKLIKVGWARDHSHFTYLMEERIMLLTQYMPLANIARFLCVSENRIQNVVDRFTGNKPSKESKKTMKKDQAQMLDANLTPKGQAVSTFTKAEAPAVPEKGDGAPPTLQDALLGDPQDKPIT
ncbi:MAG: transposase family protein [Deltaproteobacteria bacterium]|jgi:transposase|nr:transposase family protein [Deltaproteobacteria bacterium]